MRGPRALRDRRRRPGRGGDHPAARRGPVSPEHPSGHEHRRARAGRPTSAAPAPRSPPRARTPRPRCCTDMRGASSRNSRPSARVRFATLRTTRSPHSRSYGSSGIGLMWMPAHTTTPPLRTARSAAGTSAPTGAKMIALSSSHRRRVVGAAGPLCAELARELPARARRACTRRPPGRGGARPGSRCAPTRRSRTGPAARRPSSGSRVRQPQRAVADQPGAQQRRRLQRPGSRPAAAARSPPARPRTRRSRRRAGSP